MTMVLIPEKVFIHLIGKTGTGKSSTGNTILGRKTFNCKSSTAAVTKAIQFETGHLGRREIEVVDGPGLVDVNTGVNQASIEAFKKVVEERKDSVHVFLMVWRYGDPLTTDDRAMVEALKKEFGPSLFRHHGIIAMTCGDNFRADTEDDGVSFDSWCQQQTGTFAELLRECKGRVVLAENARPIAKRDQEALESLGDVIDSLDLKAATGLSLAHNKPVISAQGTVDFSLIFLIYLVGTMVKSLINLVGTLMKPLIYFVGALMAPLKFAGSLVKRR